MKGPSARYLDPSRSLLAAVVVLTLLGWILRMCGIIPLDWMAAGLVRPFLAAESFVEERIDWFWQGFGDSRDENQKLREQLARIELERNVIRNELASAQALLKTVRLPPPAEWTYLPAPVLARDAAGFDRRFRIGVGIRQGVANGNVVLADGAVLGRVRECTANTAVVVSLLDPACQMGVGVDNTQAVGALEGEAVDREGRGGSGLVQVSRLPRDLTFHAGDILTTASFGIEIPGGLILGELVADSQGRVAPLEEGNLDRRALLKPMVSSPHDAQVIVLIRKK